MDTMDHIEGRITGTSLNSDSFCPKDSMNNAFPLAFVTIARLHNRFANRKMLPLNESVRLRVITGNSNMMYTVFGADVVCSRDECWTVVCNDFCNSSPSTQNVFENEVPKG